MTVTNIKYCIEREDIEDNIDYICNKLGKKISAKKACEYFQNNPADIYNVFELPDTLEIPEEDSVNNDTISEYISNETDWLIYDYDIATGVSA